LVLSFAQLSALSATDGIRHPNQLYCSLSTAKVELGQAETVFLVYGIPDAMRGRTRVTSVALGNEREIKVIPFGVIIEEAKVGVTVIAPGKGNTLLGKLGQL
jgi:hypothetical protein